MFWLAGLYAIPYGEVPTGIVSITLLFEPSITDTLLGLTLLTYMLPLAESYATPEGLTPTGIVATTVLVRLFITDTVFDRKFAT